MQCPNTRVPFLMERTGAVTRPTSPDGVTHMPLLRDMPRAAAKNAHQCRTCFVASSCFRCISHGYGGSWMMRGKLECVGPPDRQSSSDRAGLAAHPDTAGSAPAAHRWMLRRRGRRGHQQRDSRHPCRSSARAEFRANPAPCTASRALQLIARDIIEFVHLQLAHGAALRLGRQRA